MRRFLLFLFTVATLLASTARAAEQEFKPGEWVSLFNGKDLTNWTPKIRHSPTGENYGDTFRVEDGMIKVRYNKDAYPTFGERFGHLFYDGEFSRYRFRVEYRFVDDQCAGGPGWALRNSGVMIHGQKPETMTVDQDFPVSIEVQLLAGNGKDKRTTSNLCTPGTNVVMDGKLQLRHCISSQSKTYPLDTWVTAEIEVHGNKVIRHILDGETVLEYSGPQLDERDENARKLIKDGQLALHGGTISLQSESHPCEFRKVEIMVLEDDDE